MWQATRKAITQDIAWLNEMAEGLGEWDVVWGSAPNGVKHQLQFQLPAKSHPEILLKTAHPMEIYWWLQGSKQIVLHMVNSKVDTNSYEPS